MSRKTLKALFHMGAKEYKEEYEHRFNDENTIHLPVMIGEHPAFIFQTPELYKQVIAIERLDKKIAALASSLPGVAISQFTNKCLIDEILLTNDIEGVHSTRKEISEILSDLSARNKQNRFVGLVTKYVMLEQQKTIALHTCQDIRKVYDDIFLEEIKATDPDNLPDGEIFRRSNVDVISASQKVIHKGLYPESIIIETFNQSLAMLHDESIDIFIRIAIFHYLFGYIHPFYDGNGRTSRFISSYLLAQQLTPLIGFRLSYTIKENISKYYKAFDVCNDSHNRGELTPFAEMFLEIIRSSMQQLLETLEEKSQKLHYYTKCIDLLPNANLPDVADLYDYLIKAALFSNIGISWTELVMHMELSESTVRSRMKNIPEALLIMNRQKGRKFYLLSLDEMDHIIENA